MARSRRHIAWRALDALEVLAIVAVAGVAVWLYIERIWQPRPESLALPDVEGRPLEMLAPEWLAIGLVLPLVWLARKWSLSDLPGLQQVLNVALRSALIAALCLAATRIVTTDYESHATTVYLVDVSESVPDDLLRLAQQKVQEAWEARGQGTLRLITFARYAEEVPIPPGAAQVPPLRRHEGEGAGLESNLGEALRLAYGLFPIGDIKRAVVISDGHLNRGDVLSEVYTASQYGVQLFAHELPFERPDEVLIRAVDFPEDITANEPFHITVDVFSTWDGEISLDMTQNEFRDISGRRFAVRAGEVTQLDVVAEVYEPGVRRFDIQISSDRDHFDDNNRIVHVLEVAGRPQVLYVEGESRARTYLARALDDERNSRVDYDLDVRTGSGFPSSVEEMDRFDLVILSDVPASDVSRTSMQALESYVSGGGSFLMVGGEDSFGPGGYSGTQLEEILPVTSESRRLESMPSVALLLVIDRSGSMEGIRLEMAKDAARAAVELLGPQDRVGVIAFDESPHRVVELQSASNRTRIATDIGRISAGGGTDILPALEEAFVELIGASARTKHIILLTDGDAPREGIADLIREMRREHITISTVGVSSEANRTLLEMIADLAGGRVYYASSPQSVPEIFVQETSRVARSSLIEEPFRPVEVTSSAATRGIDFASVPYLLGYVTTRARSQATVGLETEQGDPLYAWWRFGRGRAAAFTSDCKNRWMVEWVRDPLYPRFWAQVVDHLRRQRSSEEETLDLEARVENGRGRVWVDAIAPDGSFVNGLSSTLSVTDPAGATSDVTLAQTAAGRYEAALDLPLYGSYQLEATHTLAGEEYAVSLESLANPYPDEYLAVGADYDLLRQAVLLGGGEIDPAAAALFGLEGEQTATQQDLWPYFLFAALGLLIVDILLRRIRLYGRTALDWGRVTGKGA